MMMHVLTLCHCAFEAHNAIINNIVVDLVTNSVFGNIMVDFGFPYSAHDCTAILYAISSMQEGDNMLINFSRCGVKDTQIKELMNILVILILMLSG